MKVAKKNDTSTNLDIDYSIDASGGYSYRDTIYRRRLHTRHNPTCNGSIDNIINIQVCQIILDYLL